MTTDTQQDYPTAEPHRVKRIAYRASYTPEVIHAILDGGYICHISFVDAGLPQIIPMTYWRDAEHVYFHAAARGRFASACASGPVALSVTLMDGLVLGHSPINHSVNFRSVIVHGCPQVIHDREEKRAAMRSFFHRTIPGRWETLREILDDELDGMTVFRLTLDQVAAKVRNEFSDDEDHMPETPVWTGILPCSTVFRAPVADDRFPLEALPDHLATFSGKPEYLERIDGTR
ncbi:flavin-nucleotide-binding protein [Burkholderia stagnalis]|uniref:pyridoxamine 5'-phosphate oxidase family protein n=1 Tax=Burkholderia stagnalis TaxID=1503054 RepID=UPI00075F4DEE|nr:pyridoxamine 5'-phosphate oxidase family protein [Burkholderia stagnalis]AOK54676.1 flavin-nucleotide-binding protein [Burkholderia stagnalis]KVC62175.1 flavin-nucleotide-binding protein [Burkholderia stagnalis]KVD96380.1 flavin-nucleotide-binding protein [Burkholderia stagnalis]KVN16433.1 flavin-nucleotide-binding protein [Burkholderia stagnalis]KVN78583.1 flavin-nucleotide-binding protein [Burkholderia stagnalis]